MKKIIIPILIAITLFSVILFTGCTSKIDYIIHDGEKRFFNVHLPSSYDPSEIYPLVFVFHGGGGNALNIEDVTGFSQKADEEDFIVVYPYGSGKLDKKLLTWNCGFCCGYALENDVNDVGFIRALFAHLKVEYSINPDMVYATGISNGGIMSYRVGAELSDIFAAVAPVAAQIGGQASEEEEIWRIPNPENPVSVMAFNGMADTRVPYDGGRPIDENVHVYSWMSTTESIAFWVNNNQCNPEPSTDTSESGNIIIDTYSEGNDDTEVILVTIVDGTHSWPGGKKGWDNGPEPTQDISATVMMWDFFKDHTKN
jgi:polyhydroxybutyrate depolymerase